ncbi:hypothetical protein [Niveispirillum sp. KHB5.9]|uniref:hypothetical protein n=1 Tax=Niveispirillum sp. KHB5.9 TaxID=3400269 RepID=UPI003A8ABF07
MSTTFLNLDDLKVNRSVVMYGRERILRSMTVQEFVESDGFKEQVEAASGDTVKQTRIVVGKLLGYMDDTTEDELLRLDMGQLMALIAFSRGEDLSKKTSASGAETEGNVPGRKPS